MKLALMRNVKGKEDPELPLWKRIRWLELPLWKRIRWLASPASECSPDKCFRVQVAHISTSTVHSRLRESGHHGWIAAKKSLLKDTNKKKRLAWVKKHEQWVLYWWKSVLLVQVQIWDLWFQPPSLCEMQSRWTACVVPTVKYGGEGVMMVWGCFAGNIVSDSFRNQGTLDRHG